MTTAESKLGTGVLFFLYGLIAYVFFLGTFCYTAGFVSNLVVPKSIDTGTPGPIGQAIIINALLLSLFVIQHTIMARPGFKAWWATIVPEPIERSTFVMATCIVLCLTFWQWRPMPEVVWSVEQPALKGAIYGLFALGWLTVLYTSFLIDHFDLFGMRQVYLNLRGLDPEPKGFVTPTLYKLVRNPLMLGFMIAFWSAPEMSQGRLLFAGLTTGYIFMGIWFEERDLLQILGEDYRRYRARTSMILPIPRRGAGEQQAATAGD